MFFNKDKEADAAAPEEITGNQQSPEPILAVDPIIPAEPTPSVDEQIALEATSPEAPAEPLVADASDKDAVKFNANGDPFYVGINSPYREQDLEVLGIVSNDTVAAEEPTIEQ